MNFFRYPGGKSKLKHVITSTINHILHNKDTSTIRYIEPFFGGGSIGLSVLNSGFHDYWFNDYDAHLAFLWKMVFSQNQELKIMIENYHPKMEDFDVFKSELLSRTKPSIDLAFKKLAIHQISYSGLGVKAGGPIGGRLQASQYTVDCRWNAKSILKKIDALHKFSPLVTNLPFNDVIQKADKTCFLYVDPPYYEKGEQLYQYGMSQNQHQELRDLLRDTDATWLLSYDDTPEIRELYKDFRISDFMATYYIANKGAKTRTKPELLITNADI